MLQIILALHLNTQSTITETNHFLNVMTETLIYLISALYSLTIRSFDGSQKKSSS